MSDKVRSMISLALLLVVDCTWTARGLPAKEPRVLIEAPEHARESVIRALHAWASVGDFRFEIVTDSPDLTIRKMEPRECGVSAMVEAFATDDLVAIRDWDSPRTLSLLIHEIGHWLGFAHSNNRSSAMFGTVQEERFDDIGSEDADAVVARYGRSESNKWTIREPLSWAKWRYRGIGLAPVGAIGRGLNWSMVCDISNCPWK